MPEDPKVTQPTAPVSGPVQSGGSPGTGGGAAALGVGGGGGQAAPSGSPAGADETERERHAAMQTEFQIQREALKKLKDYGGVDGVLQRLDELGPLAETGRKAVDLYGDPENWEGDDSTAAAAPPTYRSAPQPTNVQGGQQVYITPEAWYAWAENEYLTRRRPENGGIPAAREFARVQDHIFRDLDIAAPWDYDPGVRPAPQPTANPGPKAKYLTADDLPKILAEVRKTEVNAGRQFTRQLEEAKARLDPSFFSEKIERDGQQGTRLDFLEAYSDDNPGANFDQALTNLFAGDVRERERAIMRKEVLEELTKEHLLVPAPGSAASTPIPMVEPNAQVVQVYEAAGEALPGTTMQRPEEFGKLVMDKDPRNLAPPER